MNRRIPFVAGPLLTAILLYALPAGASEAGTPTRLAQEACTASGLVAGTAGYAACVANLTATLDRARELGS